MKRTALSSKQSASGRSHRPVGCSGFALLEVLVAFTILTLFLGVLFQVFSTGVRSARLGEEEGEESGSFNDVYNWRASLEAYEWRDTTSPGELPARPFVVTVEVFWGEDPQRRSVALTSLTLVQDNARGLAENE